MFTKFDKANFAAIAAAAISWAGTAYGVPPGLQEAVTAAVVGVVVYLVKNKDA
jgi:hypothetical protein